MRRQTLGPISPSAAQMNRGGTTAPSRVAATANGNAGKGESNGGSNPQRPSSRKSMLPSDSSNNNNNGPLVSGIDTRRSSAYNNGGKAGNSNGLRNDPRPITDKAFVTNCIRTVITYLSTHGYPAAISPKTLASPTTKDFTLVVQFLFQKFDPRYSCARALILYAVLQLGLLST